MPPILLQILLYLHIACGGTALITGGINMIVTKGGKLHRRSGKIFFYCMMVVSASAFTLSIAKNIPYLLAIAIFSFYMNYSGYRALKNRDGKFKWYDWLVNIFALGTAVYMVSTFTVVLDVFGLLLLYIMFGNLKLQFQGEEKIKEARRTRMLFHISNMVGTYIATFTAFLVVNINFVKPGWIVWLFPTVIFVPFALYWRRKWKQKLNPA